jgi:hypothetical protein
MSSTPIIPPGGMPPIPPHWRGESDWVVLIEFLRKDDAEDRVRGTEAIGYMFAYSQMTDARMLALVGDPNEDAYELLFSFSSPFNKAEFLRLLQSNDATACVEVDILIPDPSEIEAAQPIALVLPADVMRQVTVIAAMMFGGKSDTIQ